MNIANPDPEAYLDICRDRPPQCGAYHSPNDWYGHADVIKGYCGFAPDYAIRAAVEHGVNTGGGQGYLPDLASPLPALLTLSGWRRCFQLAGRTQKLIAPLGPLIRYATPYLSEARHQEEKIKLGRCLLAFPIHSTHHIDQQYDIGSYCAFLRDSGRDFDSVRVCLYWKDALRGDGRRYLSHGIPWISAGHMFDPLFLSRLRSIIALSDVTTSYTSSTQLSYCVALGKPHILTYGVTPVSAVAGSNEIIERDVVSSSQIPYLKELKAIFSQPTNYITKRQKDFMEQWYGHSIMWSPEEVRMICSIAERIWTIAPCGGDRAIAAAICHMLNNNENESALMLADLVMQTRPWLADFDYARSVALLRCGRLLKSKESLEFVLAHNAAHRKAKELLRAIG